jgi:hypothetical protein
MFQGKMPHGMGMPGAHGSVSKSLNGICNALHIATLKK